MHVGISGLTASGKTTVATHLATVYRCVRLVTSDALLRALRLESVKKEERLRAWLAGPGPAPGRIARHPLTDRFVDLAAVDEFRVQEDIVAETLTLPWLCSPENTALWVLLQAPEEIRAERIRRNMVELALDDALTIVRRKDAETRAAMLDAWGVDVTSPGLAARYDLVLVNDERMSADDLQRIVAAAVDVYRCHIGRDETGDIDSRVHRLRGLLDRFGTVCTRASPLLLDVRCPSVDRWTCRQHEECAGPRVEV